MTMSNPGAEAQAIEWAMRADAPGFEGWAELEAWLADDPEHAVLFDEATIAIDEAAQAWRTREVVTPLPPPARTAPVARRFWIPAGIAAALAGAIAVGTIQWRPPAEAGSREIATLAGEVRTLDLGKTGRITLNGDTRLRLDPQHPHQVELTRGQASFSIAHDASRPFTVRSGDVVVTDVGTVFDVAASESGTRVAVSQGAVQVRGAGKEIAVRAGEESFVAKGDAPTAVQSVEPASVGSWQAGLLTYDDTSLAQLVEDVNRRTGLHLTLAPSLATRRFAGAINVRGTPAEVIPRIEATLGVTARRTGDTWVLEPAGR